MRLKRKRVKYKKSVDFKENFLYIIIEDIFILEINKRIM